ncbi:hypothetical protein SAMN05443377_1393 [Propionibacterium cyclohexanicum]|uniref:Uncharacterized protein n=1 Tax=Propionibacterium cyclohexanicum TaxID=64702 RepID=A0A1H9U461_9ACTN|nr:hypothetical protein SAMN05443377_1393 [Propionibacterium cyclohexanicum]
MTTPEESGRDFILAYNAHSQVAHPAWAGGARRGSDGTPRLMLCWHEPTIADGEK